MRTTSFIAALLASTALAACGGGEEQAADTSDAAEASTETAATETSGEDMSGGDMGGETDMAAEEPMAEEPAAEEPMADPQEAPAETEAAEAGADDGEAMADAGDAAGSDGQFMVAGLTGDPEAGRRVFARCRSCHVLEEGVNRVGPSLYGIFGRETGSVEGFRYSEANANAGITWTHETMFEYLENPREYIPGTIMAFPGLRDEQDRADVVAYISANGGEG